MNLSSKLRILYAITNDTSIQADADYLNSMHNAFAHSVAVYNVPSVMSRKYNCLRKGFLAW